jgi:hypothetical protein
LRDEKVALHDAAAAALKAEEERAAKSLQYADQVCGRVKRDVCVWQKRPIHMAKEAC